MELGNMFFGNSRGSYDVPRDSFQKLFFELLEQLGFDYHGEHFDNDTFTIRPYYWGDCDCGYEEGRNKFIAENEHSATCSLMLPNFVYKPAGFEIQWYKYPMRDAYMNQDIKTSKFTEIIEHCKESIDV